MIKKKFIVPKVDRQIEFREEEFRKNDLITEFDESRISKKEWQEFKKNALVISYGCDVYQYADEYPIVKYSGTIDNEKRLNAFINSITVSTVMNGAQFSLKKRKMKREFTAPETVAYFENSIGMINGISVYDIYRILMKKPNLTVSSEGVLIFYTEKECLATIDCVHYTWMNARDISLSFKGGYTDNAKFLSFVEDGNYKIEKITACDGFCKISFAKTNESEPFEVKVTFKIDNLSANIIDYGIFNQKNEI